MLATVALVLALATAPALSPETTMPHAPERWDAAGPPTPGGPAVPGCSAAGVALADALDADDREGIRLYRAVRQEVELARDTVWAIIAVAPILVDSPSPGELANRTVERVELCAFRDDDGAWLVAGVSERSARNVSVEPTLALSAFALAPRSEVPWEDLADLRVREETFWLYAARHGAPPEGEELLALAALVHARHDERMEAGQAPRQNGHSGATP